MKINNKTKWVKPSLDEEYEEFERTSEEENIPLAELTYGFERGKLVPLSDNIWSILVNQDSWQIKNGDMPMAVKLAIEYGKDYEKLSKGFAENITLPAPIIVKKPDGEYYQIAGNTRLMFAKALGIRPYVWLFKLDPRMITLYHGTSSVFIEQIKSNGLEAKDDGNDKKVLFLTDSQDEALGWAEMRVENLKWRGKEFGYPVVVKVRVPAYSVEETRDKIMQHVGGVPTSQIIEINLKPKQQLEEALFKSVANKLLTEASKATQHEVFHGTCTKFLNKILAYGVVPEPKQRVWEPGANNSSNKTDGSSVGGSYWTSNLMTAAGYSLDAKSKFGGQRMIVVAKVIPKTGYADEDNINLHLEAKMSEALESVVGRWGYVSGFFRALGHIETNPSDMEKAEQTFAEKFHDILTKNKNHPVDYELMKEAFHIASDRKLAYIKKEYKEKLYSLKSAYVEGTHGKWPEGDIPPFISPQEADKKRHEILDRLTKRYRETTKRDDSFTTQMNHIRFTGPIDFNGKNKIVAIYELRDIGNYGVKIIIHYGSVSNTPRFIQEYRSKRSSEFKIYDIYDQVVYSV